LSSLFVAMVISPVQAAVFIQVKKQKEKNANRRFRPVGKFIEAFDKKFFGVALGAYEKALRWSLRHRKTTVGATVGLLIFMFVIYGMFNNGVEFFPNTEPSQALINITLPVGTNIKVTNEVTQKIEEKLAPYKDIEYYVSSVGSEIGGGFSGGVHKGNVSTITLNFKDKDLREQSSFKTIEEI